MKEKQKKPQVNKEYMTHDLIFEPLQEVPHVVDSNSPLIQDFPPPLGQRMVDVPVIEPQTDEMFPWMRETIILDTRTV